MPRIDWDEEYGEEMWAHKYRDVDLDLDDEFPGPSEVNSKVLNVHASDVDVESGDCSIEFNYGVQRHQHRANDEIMYVNDEAYMVDQGDDGVILTNHLDMMRLMEITEE